MPCLCRSASPRGQWSAFAGALLLIVAFLVSQSQAAAPTATSITSSGLGTVVTPLNATETTITGGTRPSNGPNLFHSFGDFILKGGDTANFSNDMALPTSNILARVTGGKVSDIYGTVKVDSNFGNASLYFINPFGVVFGPTASLNVGGSVHITTADYLKMGASQFFAYLDGTTTKSTLTTDPVSAFGFFGPIPSDLAARSPVPPGTPGPISVESSALVVPIGQTLSLIGGDITIVGRGSSDPAEEHALLSVGGRINLISVASVGEVVTNAPDEPTSLKVDSFQQLGTISIADKRTLSTDSALGVGGDPGGTIFIRSGRLELTDAGFTASSIGAIDHPGLGIDIQVTGDIVMNRAELGSSSLGSGNAGAIRIAAGSLQMVGDAAGNQNSNIGSRAFSTAADAGNGNDIEITTGTLQLHDNTAINTTTFGPGQAGNIRVNTGTLEILAGPAAAFISSSTQGAGNAGSLEISAQTVRLLGGSGFTGLASQVSAGGTGNASTLRVNAQSMEILNGAQINAAVFSGSGRGGDIDVTADSLLVSGRNVNGFSAGIFSDLNFPARGTAGNVRVYTTGNLMLTNGGLISSFSGSFGNSGNINVRTTNLSVTNGATVTSTNFGAGLGGRIDIEANNVVLAGPGPGSFTGLFAIGGFLSARAGDITVRTGKLDILDGALITARTSGIGQGGTIDITADHIFISGTDPSSGSAAFDGISAGITASNLALQPRPDLARGNAGDIRIRVVTLDVQNDGTIRALSTGSGNAGTIAIDAETVAIASGAVVSGESTGPGNAGTVSVTAANTLALTAASITTETVQGIGGDIALWAQGLMLQDGATVSTRSTGRGNSGNITIVAADLFQSHNSAVTTEATQAFGGNIDIQTQRMIQLTDSRIVTSVQSGAGNGGNITIDPQFLILDNSQILAQAVAGNGGNISIMAGTMMVSPGSVISATSQAGISGQVAIQAPVNNVATALSRLSQTPLNAAELLTARCSARLREGRTSSLTVAGRDGVPAEPGSWRPTAFPFASLRSPTAPALAARPAATDLSPLVPRPSGPELQAMSTTLPLPAGCGS